MKRLTNASTRRGVSALVANIVCFSARATLVTQNVSQLQKGTIMRFCTVINCMDGRIQIPVINYLQNRFNVDYVDSITESGPNLILAENSNKTLVKSILARLKISIEHHHSIGVAIVGHHDCAGNPASKEGQLVHIKKAIEFILQQYGKIEIIGLWVDENWKVDEIMSNERNG